MCKLLPKSTVILNYDNASKQKTNNDMSTNKRKTT